MSTTSLTTKSNEPTPTESFALGADQTRLYVRSRSRGDVRSGSRGDVRSGSPADDVARCTSLMCDGIVCDGFIYKYLWDDLFPLGDVVRWHYRGHGRSARPADASKVTVADQAADLDCVRRHVGDPRVVLFGHSYGTQVCLEAYRLRPDKIAAMVLLCGSFGRVTHTFKGTDILASVLPKLTDFVVQHPKLARAVWSRMPTRAALKFALMTGDIDPKTIRAADVEPYFQHMPNIDFTMFLHMLQCAGEHSAEDLLPKIDIPVLVVSGEHDSFTPPALSEAMAELIPGGELMVIPGGTHVAPLEHHEQLALRIEKFFSDHGL